MTAPLPKVEERWPCGVTTQYDVLNELAGETTPFQAMELVESKPFGRMLLLDGIVQTTERDEFVYHEMMTHVPLLTCSEPKRVLVIGGGDGGILREVLRHPSVELARLVEIDAGVIEFSKRLLPGISDGAFDDPRVDVVIDDGAVFIARDEELYDVIIIDSSDPIGPATVLFAEAFCRDAIARLAPGGVLVRQTGSTWMQPDELPECCAIMQKLCEYARPYLYAVPTYVGGLFSSLCCSKDIDPSAMTLDELASRFGPLDGRTKYYTPGVHLGAFQIPPYVGRRLP